MPRKSTAWAVACTAVFLTLSGCRFFGIDTRPEIRYVTEGQRKEVSEPMYSMPVAGTRLFKQWPMRLGADYGFAPWERKPAGAGPAVDAIATAKTAAPPADAATAPPTGLAAAKTAKPAKPSDRATPRLAGGELAEQTVPASDAAAGDPRTAGEATHLVADDFDVPVAARDMLDFHAPTMSAPRQMPAADDAATPTMPPNAAAAVVSRAPIGAAATRLPSDENLSWLPSGDEPASAAGTIATQPAAATSATSSIGLQQPGVFSARKASLPPAQRSTPQSAEPSRAVTTSSRNMLRDDAVRPAAAMMPIERPAATPAGVPRGVPAELIPPTEDTMYDAPDGLPLRDSLGDSVRDAPGNAAAATDRMSGDLDMHSIYGDAQAELPRPAAASEFANRTASQREPTVVRPPASYDDEEPVFVTASDMGPVADPPTRRSNVAPAREYVNPYYSPSAADTYGADQSIAAPPSNGKLGELEAVKRALVR